MTRQQRNVVESGHMRQLWGWSGIGKPTAIARQASHTRTISYYGCSSLDRMSTSTCTLEISNRSHYREAFLPTSFALAKHLHISCFWLIRPNPSLDDLRPRDEVPDSWSGSLTSPRAVMLMSMVLNSGSDCCMGFKVVWVINHQQ